MAETHPEDKFAALLRRWRESLERQEEQALVRLHLSHFIRRVRAFDRGFFPGGEKSEDAFTSLGNGAFTSFDKETIYEGAPAFDNVLQRHLPAVGYLYRWRASATVQYLKREGPELLQERFRMRRNIQIHLREGFEVVGFLRSQRLWGPVDLPLQERAKDQIFDPDSVQIEAEGLRGKALVREVLRAAGVPLTRDEIAHVVGRLEGVQAPQEINVDDEGALGATQSTQALVDAQRLEEQVSDRVDRLFARLNDKQRRLLLVRGWADERPQVSFKEAAKRHGAWSEESCRQHEKKLLERIARHFTDVDELRAAGRRLAMLLTELHAKEAL